MSTPIERGAEALTSPHDVGGRDGQTLAEIAARAVFESIELEGVARSIHDDPTAMTREAHSWDDCPHQGQYLADAAAVIAWLTSSTPDTTTDPTEES